MATFQELQDRVENRVIDLPAAVTGEIPTLVNSAIRSLEQKYNYRAMESTLAATTTENEQVLVARPNNWKAARGRPYVRRGQDGELGDWPIDWALTFNAVIERWNREDPLTVGEPSVVFENEDNFEVYPLPDALSDWTDGDHRVVIPYWKYLTDLSAGSDTNWFTVNAEEYIVARAAAEAFFINQDGKWGAFWLIRAEGDPSKQMDKGLRGTVEALDRNARLQGVQIYPRPGPNGYYRR